jgi:CspA family cold shock protein
MNPFGFCFPTKQEGITMATGRVKWFNNAKGYGFILPDNGGGDLFAHYSSIEMEGYKTLKAGQSVTFDIIEGDKGLHAIKIVPEIEESQINNSNNNVVAEADESPTRDSLEAI